MLWKVLKLWKLRGWWWIIGHSKISLKYNKSKNLAFSLIELSIVLIIIGLLVAGITGGKSLIESAKIRVFANETLSYKQTFMPFKVAKRRLPGDLNGDGYIGSEYNGSGCAAETYTTSSFSALYNAKTPNQISGSFVDLYLEGLIDFMPDPENIAVIGKSNPYSKIYKDGYYDFNPMGNFTTSDYVKNSKFGTIYLHYYNSKGLSPKIIKKSIQ